MSEENKKEKLTNVQLQFPNSFYEKIRLMARISETSMAKVIEEYHDSNRFKEDFKKILKKEQDSLSNSLLEIETSSIEVKDSGEV
ncbi:MAG: hypothetical protein Q8P81_03715 [Nanoarchaeota archaeon]|nr:hypothetical protein [Nanoarchaeota archaeon]